MCGHNKQGSKSPELFFFVIRVGCDQLCFRGVHFRTWSMLTEPAPRMPSWMVRGKGARPRLPHRDARLLRVPFLSPPADCSKCSNRRRRGLSQKHSISRFKLPQHGGQRQWRRGLSKYAGVRRRSILEKKGACGAAGGRCEEAGDCRWFSGW